MSERAGRLSIVATPIGNLEDITLRALRTLREADLVLAEDTRRTRVLLQQHGLHKQLSAYHAHSGPRDTERVLEALGNGQHVALVTDAGTPLVSDPGAELVREAQARGIQVESIPGASAVLAALTVCGLRTDSFRFLGFLPRQGKRRRAALAELVRDRSASVIFESPQRLAASLRELAELLPADRELAVCRELTKLHEEVVRGSAAELAEHFAKGARGEITVVISGAPAESEPEEPGEELDQRIAALLAEGQSPRDVVRALLSETPGITKQALYARVNLAKENLEP
ncbi:MAG TPA: 16S rRNA (cytidine(1402)-2'-O)-methyltransferase [Polyangiales bacterium]|nr:16S rRNA (cytidine(1402)-2'-O)-methyltransferase [Polyangiales bacterium]